jgi:Protein of unknown function (DUF1236)
MNRTNLLATGAIVAFVFATGASLAQQEHGGPAPAEKMAPSGAKQPSAGTHQNDEGQNTPAGRNEKRDGRVGETPQNRGRSETTGQAPREDQSNRPNERTTEPKRGEVEHGPRSERSGQAPVTGQAPHENPRGRTTEENRGTMGQGAPKTRADISITPEKRTRIHETIIRERSAPRVSSVNFDISVGTKVPGGVRFAALPQPILEIEPAWRGFEYFLVGEKIVIVDPTSMEIVAFIDA